MFFLVCIDILPHGNISSSHSFPHGLVSSYQQNLIFPSVESIELYSHWSMLEHSLWPALISFCPLFLAVQPYIWQFNPIYGSPYV